MNAQQVVVGIYLALEKCGGKNLVEKTRAAARAAGCSFSNAESSVWLKPFLRVHGRKTDEIRTENGRFAGRKIKHETDGSADGKRTRNGRETDSRVVKESRIPNNSQDVLPPETNVSVPPAPEKPKAVKVVDEVPEVSFEPGDEVRINGLVLERNPSGKIDPHVLRRFRAECRAKFVLVGAACWRYGVDTALAKPAGWPYAVQVMASNPAGAKAPRPSARGAPKERYVPENLRPSAEKLAFYDQLGKRSNAIRQGDTILGRQQAAAVDVA